MAGALETQLAYVKFVWHYFLNFDVRINKLDSDGKAGSPLNQQQTILGRYVGGNRGKISQVKRSHGLTGLLVESPVHLQSHTVCWQRDLKQSAKQTAGLREVHWEGVTP